MRRALIFQRLVPEDLVLPALVPFPNTFMSKKLSEALKLTRHSPSTRSSPFAMYMTSKGLTSWEASIKARPIVALDDITPAGWKVVETHKGDASIINDPKKKSGGLFSFFGRKVPATDSTRSDTSSPVNMSGIFPRPSTENSRSSITQSVGDGQSTLISPVVSLDTPVNSKVDFKPKSDPLLKDPSIDGTQTESTTPSAISRFIGRISGRTTTSASKDLSADDLEFLADVPTITNGEATKGLELNGLSKINKTLSVPKALPAPLPPPPHKPSPPPRQPLLPAQLTQPAANNDIFDIFDQKSVTPVLSKPTIGFTAPSLPPALTPPPRISTPLASVVNSLSSSKSSERDQTWTSFEHPSAPMKKPTSATSQAIRRTSATMNSSNISPTPPKPTPSSPFPLPPPPSISQTLPVFDLFSAPQSAAPLPPPIDTNEEEEFSDFLSSPAVNDTHTSSIFMDDFSKTSAQTVSLTNVKTITLPKEDFHCISDPLPPPTPEKLPMTPRSTRSESLASFRPIPSSQSGKGHVRKVSRKADHARTLSLLETAAARDRWLAPPSPIPEALAPPPNSSTSGVGLLGSGEIQMQNQQAHATASLGASHSSPAVASSSEGAKFRQLHHLPPPPLFKSPMLQPSTVTHVASRPLQPALGNKNGASSENKASIGGLSAQDLSFFEGL